jgi:hypothetical protein
MTSRFRSPGAFVVILTALCWAAPASAEDPVNRVTDLNKKAVEAYENLDMDEASKYLRQALELCAAEGLNSHKVKARTHIHLGIVLVGGYKKRDQGIQQFKRALEIDPTIKPTKSLNSPEIQAAFDEAAKDMNIVPGGGAPPVAATQPPTPRPAESPKPAPVVAAAPRRIVHSPVTTAPSDSTISIKASIEGGLGPSDKLILAYRPEGASDFLARDMEANSEGSFVARIPEPATRGAIVSYYLEARNKAGQALVSSGNAAEPYVITLAEGSAITTGEDPTAILGRSHGGDLEDSTVSGGEHKYWLGFGFGSGFGWARGTPEVNPTDKSGAKITLPGGFAPARLMHLVPEVGFYLSPSLLLSLQGRIQIVTSATEVRDASCPDNQDSKKEGLCAPARWALAFLGKASWLLRPWNHLRPVLSLSAGGGEIRHLVKINNLTDCGADKNTTCQDTLLGGLVLFGPGAALSYDLSRGVSAIVGANMLVGVPNPTVNLDINIGMAVNL